MAIVCSVDYSTALGYKGVNLSTKYNNKKHKVYLKLVCDDLTLLDGVELAKASKNILMVEYRGLDTNPSYMTLTQDTGVYIGRVVDFGNNITVEDIERTINDIPSGITPIINLPDDFKDIQYLWKLSKQFPRVRFSGGYLFAIDGVKIGAIGVDILSKLDIKFDESSYLLNSTLDVLEDVDITTKSIPLNLTSGIYIVTTKNQNIYSKIVIK